MYKSRGSKYTIPSPDGQRASPAACTPITAAKIIIRGRQCRQNTRGDSALIEGEHDPCPANQEMELK